MRVGCALTIRCAVGQHSYGEWWERRLARSGAWLQAAQRRGCSKDDVFAFCNVSNASPFLRSCFQSHGCFNFSSCSCKIHMNRNCVKYLQGSKFSQLTLAEKNEIKNLCRASTDLVISHSSSSTIQTYVRKCNTAIYAKLSDSLALLEETLY